MPSMWGATAAGAGEGLDALLERLLKESQQAEVGRHNLATEGLQGKQIEETGAMRQLTQQGLDQSRQSAAEDRDLTRLSTAIGRRPDNAPVSATEHDRELKAGVSTEGNYQAKLPAPVQGIQPSDPGQDVDILDAETIKTNPMSYDWDARDPNRAPPAPDKGTVHDTDKGLIRTFADGHSEPVNDPSGKQANAYRAPDRVLVQSGNEYIPRSEAAHAPLADTAATRSMSEGAKMILPHVNELAAQAQELDKRGLFGPLAGRMRDLMTKYGSSLDSANPDEAANAWNSLGNDIANDPTLNTDRLMGQFSTTLGLMASGAGRVHGGARGGGSAQMLAYFKQMLSGTSSLPMFLGRMDALGSYMKTYAEGPQKLGGPAAPEGDDPLGLLGPKK